MSQQHLRPRFPAALPILGVLMAGLMAGPSFAQNPPALPGPTCTAPVIPTEPLDEARANVLREGLNQYKQCIQQYVEKHQTEAQRHQQAANGAVNEFNAFIRKNFPKSDGSQGGAAATPPASAPPAATPPASTPPAATPPAPAGPSPRP